MEAKGEKQGGGGLTKGSGKKGTFRGYSKNLFKGKSGKCGRKRQLLQKKRKKSRKKKGGLSQKKKKNDPPPRRDYLLSEEKKKLGGRVGDHTSKREWWEKGEVCEKRKRGARPIKKGIFSSLGKKRKRTLSRARKNKKKKGKGRKEGGKAYVWVYGKKSQAQTRF